MTTQDDPFLRRIAELRKPARVRRFWNTGEPRRWAKAGATLNPGVMFTAIDRGTMYSYRFENP